MTARLKALPDALRGGAWPSPARVVRCLVKSSKPLCGGCLMCDYWLYWLAGLWDADRGSSAKGVVSLKNRCYELPAGFIVFSRECFGIDSGRFKVRLTIGYSPTIDVYYCSSKVRRKIEDIVFRKEKLMGNYARAFIAGKLDGDGYVNDIKREIYIGYSINNISEAKRDAKILENLGIEYKIAVSHNVVKLRMHKPGLVAETLYPFVLHPVKRTRLSRLIQK
jgi:hypothetical protein